MQKLHSRETDVGHAQTVGIGLMVAPPPTTTEKAKKKREKKDGH